MKVFHYMHANDWSDIKNGSWRSKDQPGLAACLRMGMLDREAVDTTACFALLEPLPAAWINNPYFKTTWEHLLRNIGDILLEISVDLRKDKAFVVDRGHMQGFLDKDKTSFPLQYHHSDRARAERAYMESKVPLSAYMLHSESMKYSLPEVIFTETVPINRVIISNFQPLLERELDSIRREGKTQALEYMLNDIKKVPELQEWLNSYKESRRTVTEGSVLQDEINVSHPNRRI